MVWNKDLAKLKQELKAEEPAGPKPPIPKPAPKPLVPQQMEDEDALFLAAMGGRRKPFQEGTEMENSEPPAPRKAAATEDFSSAMASLKGMKPVARGPLPQAKEAPVAPKPADPAQEALVAEAQSEPAEAAPSEPVPLEPARPVPPLIQLAAGMAIEVDGALDLRWHSPVDAIERLRERILDGHLLGWRTFHIQLGSSEELREAFLAFLSGPDGSLIARYAQAPIPMGGAQAWILYLGLQNPATH